MNSSESIQLHEKDPFQWIEKGNEYKIKYEYFKASEAYLNASWILDEKASLLDTFLIQPPRNIKELEHSKIAALYRDKSLDYFHEARRCFVSGLEQEYSVDVETLEKQPSTVEQVLSMGTSWKEDKNFLEHVMTRNSLTEQELSTRYELFHQLFMMGNYDPKEEQSTPTTTTLRVVQEQHTTKSLEERLAMLESSLPSRLKSDHERFQDLKKGLEHLGGVHYSTTSSAPSSRLYLDELESLDEETQVDQIVQMAKDTVTLEGHDMDSNQIHVMDTTLTSYLHHEEDNSDMDHPIHDTINSIHEHHTINDTTIMNDEPSMEQVRNLIQSITRIETNEKEKLCNNIETPHNDTQHHHKKATLQDWIEEAQQLLLQVSLCFNESNDLDSNQNNDDDDIDKESNTTTMDKNPILEMGKDSLLQMKTLVEEMLASWPK